MQHKEYELQKQICQYLEIQYENVLFMSDTIANVKLNMGQAVRNKAIQKTGFKCPDLIIFEPIGKYSGLFIELKIETPFKKNGQLKKNDHIEGQAHTMNTLTMKGYKCRFAWTFEMAKNFIDKYLSGKDF